MNNTAGTDEPQKPQKKVEKPIYKEEKEMADWLKSLISALVNITVKLIEKWLDCDINGDGKTGL